MGSIDTYNGSCVLAMAGEHCVAICSDRRLGVNMQTISKEFDHIFRMNDTIYLGLSGLATDIRTVYEKLRYETSLVEHQEERLLTAEKFTNMLANMLYEKRFGPYFITPVVAGLINGEPYLATSDCIGAMSYPKDFATGGTAEQNLFGICESLWHPGMGPEELAEVAANCLTAAVERDGISGWGGILYLITPEGVTVREIKTRMD